MSTDAADNRPEYLQRFFPRRQPHPGGGAAAAPMPQGQARPYAMKAVNDELTALGRAPEGTRNGRLNEAAFNLSQLVAGGYLDRDETWQALRITALAIGLTESETEKTLRSGFTAGERQPRHVADTGGYEAPAATVLHLPPGGAPAPGEAPEEEPFDIRTMFPVLDWHDLWANEEEDEWIVEPLIPARRLVALFSPPKVGKSLLMLELAVRVALGRTTLGYHLDRPRRVLYVDFENDPRGDVRSRLQAMGYSPHHLDDLLYLSYPTLGYLDTAMGGVTLLAVAQAYGAELVVIDTISRAVQGEENANDTWLSFYRNTGQRMKDAGIAVVRLDHTGKDEAKGMRGGSAKYGDVDAVWAMSRVSDTVFRLTCTDNRLPITEKVLTIRRHLHPLRHEVDLDGRRTVIAEAVAALDALGFPNTGSLRDAVVALKDAGATFGRNITHDAQRERQRKASLTTLTYEDDA